MRCTLDWLAAGDRSFASDSVGSHDTGNRDARTLGSWRGRAVAGAKSSRRSAHASSAFGAEATADIDVLERCFEPNVVVRDEGRVVRGLDAIKAWKLAAPARYQYRAAPLSASCEDATATAIARLTGSFQRRVQRRRLIRREGRPRLQQVPDKVLERRPFESG